MKRTTKLVSAIGVLALGAIGSVIAANPAQARSHAHMTHAQSAHKAFHAHKNVHAAETDATADGLTDTTVDGPGGHEDIGDNVDHQFDGSE